jgi:peptide/nickel transport system permease protein
MATGTTGWVLSVTPQNWRRWLLTDTPHSRLQARAGRAYLGWVAFARNPLAMIGLIIILGLIAMAIFAPWLTEFKPTEAGPITDRLLPPGGAHWLGTDQQQRDIWSRIVFGSRTTLLIIFMVMITAAPLGIIIGTTAGYVGGWLDSTLMRITDAFLAFPKIVLALAFAALGAGIENAILAIAITSWPPYARIARAETLTIRNTDYIAAAQMSGASGLRVLVGHIMPMCMPSLIVRVTLDMAGVILTAAGLGFLGLGVAPPQPEWGSMVSDGRNQILDQWWICTYPGIAIFIVSLGFNLMGDGLRDVLDPREN